MKRKIVEIDEDKCTGCSLCANACHEGAIIIENGKAKVTSNALCDGLGDCLPHCPSDAIKITVKDVELYDHNKVLDNLKSLGKTIKEETSLISNWPIQIKLVSSEEHLYDGAHLLIAADCTAFTYKNFQDSFMKGRVLLIGCNKLDNYNYAVKLSEIIKNNDIKSICLVRMEVPCCKGLEMALNNALILSGKKIHTSVRVISIKGELLECY